MKGREIARTWRTARTAKTAGMQFESGEAGCVDRGVIGGRLQGHSWIAKDWAGLGRIV